MTDSNDFKFKIALIGDSSTGKSTLLRRLIGEHNLNCNDQNNNDSSPHEKTIGVDFKRYNLILPESNVNVALSFYDTSGDPLYRHITLSYLDNVQGYLIAYDVQNMESFLNCQYWHNEINKRHNCTETSKKKPCTHLIKVLVGCKSDQDSTIESGQLVPNKKAREFAKKNGFVLFYETSAKTDLNISSLFEELCMELISNYIKYLQYQEELQNLVSIPCTSQGFMLHQHVFPLIALSTKSDVYFNCSTEKLNCSHVIMNSKNSKRKNLQTKRFELMDLF